MWPTLLLTLETHSGAEAPFRSPRELEFEPERCEQ